MLFEGCLPVRRGTVILSAAKEPGEKLSEGERNMFDFKNKKNNRIVVWIIVGVLVACMVVPTAYYLIASIFGGSV